MTPFYFGNQSRRLFGVYEPARRKRAETRAVVLCQPWGGEYTYAHRTMRHLAKLLADEGVHTLRFDYFGTGDSGGSAWEGTLEGWKADIVLAGEELRTVTGATQVGLAGLRLGATLAAEVAARQTEMVAGLVLWDPVMDGMDYVKELLLLARTKPVRRRRPLARPPTQGGGWEVLGHPLTAALVQEMNGLKLPGLLTNPAVPTHLLLSATALLPPGFAPENVEVIAAPPPWILRWPDGEVPVQALQRIVQWMA